MTDTPSPPPRLLIATRNSHKVGEIQAVLGQRFRYLSLRDLPGAPEPEETGATFEENARIKAHALAAWILSRPPAPEPSPRPDFVLADDSGLEVDALHGAPGVRSARYAADDFGLAGNAPDGANNAKLLRALAEVPAERRTGRFRCALALTVVNAALDTYLVDGACEGRLGWIARGAHGFGYDPLFHPEGFEQTFAELGEATKNAISHRARALARLLAWWDEAHPGGFSHPPRPAAPSDSAYPPCPPPPS